MATAVSLTTVGVSASVSIVTSYFGTIINFNRLRNRHRRVLGLSLLAEIKSLQRRLRRHYQRLEIAREALPQALPKLTFESGDTSVFNNGSGNLGLFTTRTAVEVLEYYSTVRALAAQAEALTEMVANGDVAALRNAIDAHLGAIRLARHHSRVVVVALRRDVPMTMQDIVRFARRRLLIALQRACRRVRHLERSRPELRRETHASDRRPARFVAASPDTHGDLRCADPERIGQGPDLVQSYTAAGLSQGSGLMTGAGMFPPALSAHVVDQGRGT